MFQDPILLTPVEGTLIVLAVAMAFVLFHMCHRQDAEEQHWSNTAAPRNIPGDTRLPDQIANRQK